MPETKLYTYADLATFPDDGLRRELFEGELVVTPAPRIRHQDISGRLFLMFGNHIAAHGGGKVLYAPADVVLSDRTVLEPDLLFIADAQLSMVTTMNIQGPPALVVEIVSNQRIDRVRKRDLYARYGVGEYWIVDPDTDRVDVLLLDGDHYAKPVIFEPGETLTTPLLPGLAIDIAALFA